MKKNPRQDAKKIVATNHFALRDYVLSDAVEAGLVLTGTEVKSLRDGKCNLKDSFARFERGELFLYNMHIAPYPQGNIFNHEPTRPRKLLLRETELLRFYGRLTRGHLTLVPTQVYFKHGLAKCEIALAKRKKAYDRREEIRKKIADREIDRVMKNRRRSA